MYYIDSIFFATILLISNVFSEPTCKLGDKIFSVSRVRVGKTDEYNLFNRCRMLQREDCVATCEWAETCRETSSWYTYYNGRRSYVAGVRAKGNGIELYCCISLAVIADRCSFSKVSDDKELIHLTSLQEENEMHPQGDAIVRDLVTKHDGDTMYYRVEICSIKRERPHCDLDQMKSKEKSRYRIVLMRGNRARIFGSANRDQRNSNSMEELKENLFTTTTRPPLDFPGPPSFSDEESRSIENSEKSKPKRRQPATRKPKPKLKATTSSTTTKKRRKPKPKPTRRPKQSSDTKEDSESEETKSKSKGKPKRRKPKPKPVRNPSKESGSKNESKSAEKPKRTRKPKPTRKPKVKSPEKTKEDSKSRKIKSKEKSNSVERAATTLLAITTTTLATTTKEKCPKPDWSPCISQDEANFRFRWCCSSLSPGCVRVCKYDTSQQEIMNEISSGRCPLGQMGNVMKCASEYNDVTYCCDVKGVFGAGRGFCRPFCNPAAHNLNFGDIGNLPCAQQAGAIAGCFRAYQNP